MNKRVLSRDEAAMRYANARAEEARAERRRQTAEEAAALGMTRGQYLMHLEALARAEGVCRKDYVLGW